MLVLRDGHLRFEAEVSLQGTVATLATDGTTFALYDARKNEFNRGPACPANVASLIRIPLAPADIAAVLLGDARLPPPSPGRPHRRLGCRAAAPTRSRCRDRTAASCSCSSAARDTTAPDRGGAHRRPTAAGCGRPPTTSSRPSGGVRLPKLIRFAEGNGSFDDGVEIQFKDRTVNAPPRRTRSRCAAPGRRGQDVGCGP